MADAVVSVVFFDALSGFAEKALRERLASETRRADLAVAACDQARGWHQREAMDARTARAELMKARALLSDANERDQLRRRELADTDAALAEYREREARANPDPRPWWEKAKDAEGGCPL